MRFVRGPLRPRRDPSGDPAIALLCDALSAPAIRDNVHSLLLYGSQTFGRPGSDYDVDLILRTHQDGDYALITAALACARALSPVCIDFEVYLLDALRLDGAFATADQGCYFLFSWALAVPVIGSTQDFVDAVERLPEAAIHRALERKLTSYFCRLRHHLVQAAPPEPRTFARTLARALQQAHLRLGTWTYDEILGHASQELFQRELDAPRVCPEDQLGTLARIAAGELDPDRAFTLVNRIEARVRELLTGAGAPGAGSPGCR